jgi:FKBP-type peptidyl-prolyl cis-trans isomerase 2
MEASSTAKEAQKKEEQKKKDKKSIRQGYVLAAIVIVAIAAGAAYVLLVGSGPSVVAVGDNVSVYYTGAFENGTVFNTNVGGKLLNFTVGANQMIEGFNNGVIGMTLGSNKTIVVPPNEGYGEENASRIMSVPRTDFGNMTLYNGLIVVSPAGSPVTIRAFNTTNVIVDFNPPLAGKTLVFQVKIVKISK